LGYLTQSVFLLHPTQVVTGTTTGKLVLWDSKTHDQTYGLNKKQLNQIDLSRQSTKMTVNRELTRDTFKSSTSTRSGTLSSRKSSGKTNEQIDQEENGKQTPFQEQQQQQQQTNFQNNNEQLGSSPMNKRALKLCEPQRKAITVLMTTDDLVVTGDSDGVIRFFDQELKLRMWFEHFRVGPIQSISFTYVTSDYSPPTFSSNITHKQNESTLSQPLFSTLDFTISSAHAVIAHVTHSGQQISIVKRDSSTAVYALDTHPFEHKLCFANASGRLQLWEYQQKTIIATAQHAHHNAITQLKYNHNGNFIAVGYADGQLTLCDALSLESILSAPFHYAKTAILIIKFSPSSKYLATAVRTN
jgi:WD40 repeat protein